VERQDNGFSVGPDEEHNEVYQHDAQGQIEKATSLKMINQ